MPRNGESGRVDPSENLSETPQDQSKGMADTLRFPVKRRKEVYYEPIAL
jgi:hypothetical protein